MEYLSIIVHPKCQVAITLIIFQVIFLIDIVILICVFQLQVSSLDLVALSSIKVLRGKLNDKNN